MKITPKDYIRSKTALERAGFMAIRNLLAEDKSFGDVATTFGIDEQTVAIVKTTSSFAEFDTITRLETEREELQTELTEVKEQEAKVKPKRWHYYVAGLILIGLVWLGVWGVIALVHWIGGLF